MHCVLGPMENHCSVIQVNKCLLSGFFRLPEQNLELTAIRLNAKYYTITESVAYGFCGPNYPISVFICPTPLRLVSSWASSTPSLYYVAACIYIHCPIGRTKQVRFGACLLVDIA
jgi:hypothetical protein